MSLQGTDPAGSFGISENYRFTVEAFRKYLEHLTEDGVLSVNLFIIPPPRTELRIMATLATALEETGVRNPGTHLGSASKLGDSYHPGQKISFYCSRNRGSQAFCHFAPL